MSIITDALKKAEQERELKAKRTAEDTKTVLSNETVEVKPVEVLLEQSHIVETHIEQSVHPTGFEGTTSFHKPGWFSSPRFRETAMIFLIVGIVVPCLSVLVLLPSWPGLDGNASIVWHSFWNANLFQIPRMYQQNVLSAKPQNFNGSGVNLPFSLSGISFQGENRYAIVNGVIVQKGDLIDGGRVKEILGREVTLDTKAGEIKLKLM